MRSDNANLVGESKVGQISFSKEGNLRVPLEPGKVDDPKVQKRSPIASLTLLTTFIQTLEVGWIGARVRELFLKKMQKILS